jgi:nitroreductase
MSQKEPPEPMDLHEALYTTRAMRRLKPDPIPLECQARILDAAIRAPSGGNSQAWRFMLVDDPDIRASLGPIYKRCADQLWERAYGEKLAAARENPDDVEAQQVVRLVNSAKHLAEHFAEVPLLLFAFDRVNARGGSNYPAVWSAMLAARAEGIGTCLTTILEFEEAEVFALLGVPADAGWRMSCCVTFGYPLGPWAVAKRRPVHEVAFRNRWDAPLGIEAPEPLWPREDA